jgi:hypothetical protein
VPFFRNLLGIRFYGTSIKINPVKANTIIKYSVLKIVPLQKILLMSAWIGKKKKNIEATKLSGIM